MGVSLGNKKGRAPIAGNDLIATTTAGATKGITETATKQNLTTLTFADGGAALHGQVGFQLPSNFKVGTLTLTVRLLWWPSVNHATQAVRLGAKALCIAAGEAIDAAWGALVEATVLVGAAGAGKLVATELTVTPAGTPAAGEYVLVDVQRDPTHVGDDYTGAVLLAGVEVLYDIGSLTV